MKNGEKPDSSKKDQERWSDATNVPLPQRTSRYAHVDTGLGILLLNSAGDSIHFCLGLLKCHPGPKATNHLEP